MNKKNIVIIGAGPAGLTSAYQALKEKDLHPIIVEESKEIGGISKTVEYKGNRIDIGGHRFFTKSDEVMNIWTEVMKPQGKPSSDDILLNRNIQVTQGGPDPEKDDNVFLTRNRVSRIYFNKKFFDYPISMKPQTFINMGFAKTMKAGFGYIGSKFHKLKEDNLENFYINRFGRPLYQMFFEKYTTKLWGRSPDQIDASWGAQRVKGLSLSKALLNALAKPFRKKNSKKVETSLIESFYYPKKGPGQLYERMASLVLENGGELYKDEKVKYIEIVNDKVTSINVETPTGDKTYKGDYFISSMPLKDLVLAMDEKYVPEEIKNIAKGLVYRDFMTVGLLVKDLKIKNKTKIPTINDRIPDTWIYVQEPNVLLGRIQVFNNWSPYMVKDNVGTTWIGLEYFVNEGDEHWNAKDEDFKNFALKELASIGIIDEVNVIDSTVIRVKKAYPAYFDTYKDINKLISFLNKIENLYCVGRNGQHRYNNMDHSMLTALDAIKSIKDPTAFKKEDIWSVNTEQEYHEEKK